MAARMWSSLKTLGWGLIALLAAQVPALAVLLWTRHYQVYPAPWRDMVGDGRAVAIVVSVSTPVLVGLLIWFSRLRSASALTDLGLTLPRSRDVRTIILAAALILAIGEGSGWLQGEHSVTPFQIDIYRSAETAGVLPWLWLCVAVIGPVGEEVLFRGYLFRGWQSSLGVPGAVVATAFAWASLHLQYQLLFIIQIFLIGLTLGYARVATGTTVSTILLHVLMNALGLLETHFALQP